MQKVKVDKKALKSLLAIGIDKKTVIRIIVFGISTIVTTLVSPVIAYFSKLIIDLLSETYMLGNTMLISDVIAAVGIVVGLTIFVLIINQVKELEQIYINHDTAKKINTYIYERLNSINYEYFEDAGTYDVITRVTANCPGIYTILNSFIAIATAIISTVSYGVLLGSIKWYFIPIIIVPCILYVLAETKNMFERYFLDISQTNDNRKLSYMHNLFRDKKSNKEIRAFNLSNILIRKYDELRKKLYKKGMNLLLKQSTMSFFLLLLSKIGLFVCLVIVCAACINSTASIGDISLVLSAGVAFSTSFNEIFSQISNVTGRVIYLHDWSIFESMRIENDDIKQIDRFEDITFNNVSYKYPNTEFIALKNINCCIKKGTTVALVGENGSGKSTFIKLLLGALKPCEGEIKVNDELQEIVLNSFRRMLSYIPQNYGRFKMTLQDNLKLGNAEIDLDSYKLKFINFREKLPKNYETPLGNIYAQGVDLSGGEWQRISIERAIIRSNTEIYIMDEPAASLDPLTESKLYERFSNELMGKTKIITSHRLGACSLADYVYVFDHGRIIEEGSHNELMELRGKYFEMYNAQRSLYERT